MGKNKKSTLKYHDIEVDSREEWEFFCWLEEAKQLGIVLDYEYQPAEFQLTDKQMYIPYFNNPNKKEKLLVREHIYTADFKIIFNIKYGDKLAEIFKISKTDIKNNSITVWVDIKGMFNRFGGDRLLPIHQKLVYDKYNVFVHKIVPRDFFKICGIPLEALKTPKGKICKIYANSGLNFIKTQFF